MSLILEFVAAVFAADESPAEEQSSGRITKNRHATATNTIALFVWSTLFFSYGKLERRE